MQLMTWHYDFKGGLFKCPTKDSNFCFYIIISGVSSMTASSLFQLRLSLCALCIFSPQGSDSVTWYTKICEYRNNQE